MRSGSARKPHLTLRAFADAWSWLRAAPLTHLPGALACWFALELPLRTLPEVVRPMAHAGLFTLTSALSAAAPARLADHPRRSTMGLALQRSSGHTLTLLILLFVLGGLGAAGVLGGGALLLHERDVAAAVLAAGCGLLVLLLLLMQWPVFITTYLYPGYSRWSVGASSWLWHGPSFGTAWRMAARDGALLGATLPLWATAVVLLGGPLALRLLTSSAALHWLASALLYLGALPALSCLTYALGRPLRVPTRFDRYQEDEA